MKNYLNFLFILLVFCIIPTDILFAESDETRHLLYGFEIRNKTANVIDNCVLKVFSPVKLTPNQKVIQTDCSHPFKLMTDNHTQNQIIIININRLPPFGAKSIDIRTDVMMFRQVNRIEENHIENYLQAEKYIESDHNEIIQEVRKLAGLDDFQTIKNIFQWVSTNIRYEGFRSEEKGALYAYQKRQGDCTEYSDLFTAMCRAAGIPARCIAGYVCENDMVLKPSGYHNWSEFYYNKVWLIADPQKKRFVENTSDYIAMRIILRNDQNKDYQFDRFKSDNREIDITMKTY